MTIVYCIAKIAILFNNFTSTILISFKCWTGSFIGGGSGGGVDLLLLFILE